MLGFIKYLFDWVKYLSYKGAELFMEAYESNLEKVEKVLKIIVYVLILLMLIAFGNDLTHNLISITHPSYNISK